jgi:hypothetical protein
VYRKLLLGLKEQLLLKNPSKPAIRLTPKRPTYAAGANASLIWCTGISTGASTSITIVTKTRKEIEYSERRELNKER